MPSDAGPDRAYVWTWLPGATEPVVAGVLQRTGDIVVFRYAQSYQERASAVPLYLPELPLVDEAIPPLEELKLANCIADAGPDRWGQHLILRRIAGDSATDIGELNPLTYLLESGSNRFGALDFQQSPTEYVPRVSHAPLGELLQAAERLDAGEQLTRELEMALFAGTSLGGARPKTTLDGGDRHLLAKFSSRSDAYAVVKAEGVAMGLARRVGLDVAATEIQEVLGRDVLLVERFDRTLTPGERKMAVSVLTLFELNPIAGYHASYSELADIVRARFTAPNRTLRELFSRMVFNVCVGNTDDHARNHAAFWDGTTGEIALTPAFDICPQPRSGGEASQAMAIRLGSGGRLSLLANCIEVASTFHLSEQDARDLIDQQIETIRDEWDAAADEARLTPADKQILWGRQILNPYCFEGC